MTTFDELLNSYDYPIDQSSIALTPASPRDSAKLLVYTRATDSMQESTFAHIAEYIPKNALLVFNDTKVIPARVYATLPTGGKIEILCTQFLQNGIARALMNKRQEVGTVLSIGTYSIHVVDATEKEYTIRIEGTTWKDLLDEYGTIPIPPYLKQTPMSESELRAEYQTIFAAHDGSVAAPTASLHFTDTVFASLHDRGIEYTFVTLHVNLGTFAPLTEEHISHNALHTEEYVVSLEAQEIIQKALDENRPIIAVGTTALRTLETITSFNKKITSTRGTTSIFIHDDYTFKAITGLITNFHVPKSSLMMLVASLIGREKLLELYAYALKHNYRFFSFGDGMLIL
jgi:S-adenosylmethionine:tRNA ribosyltransferase-isomerase